MASDSYHSTRSRKFLFATCPSCWSLKWTTYGQNSNNSLIGMGSLHVMRRRSDVNNFDPNSFFLADRTCLRCFQLFSGNLLAAVGQGWVIEVPRYFKSCIKTFKNVSKILNSLESQNFHLCSFVWAFLFLFSLQFPILGVSQYKVCKALQKKWKFWKQYFDTWLKLV